MCVWGDVCVCYMLMYTVHTCVLIAMHSEVGGPYLKQVQ